MKNSSLLLLCLSLCSQIWAQQNLFIPAGISPEMVSNQLTGDPAGCYTVSKEMLAECIQFPLASRELVLPLGNEQVTVQLARSFPASPQMRVRTSGGEVIEPAEGLHYQGKVAGMPTSLVAISLFEDEVIGVIMTDEGNYNIGQVIHTPSLYISYNDHWIENQPEFACAELPVIPSEELEGNSGGYSESNEHLCRLINVYIEADYELYQDKGSNTTTVTNFVNAFFNVCKTIYANENLNIQISELFIWTTQDPYDESSSNTALEDFGDNVQDNFNGDIAHLITTVNNNNGGLAWLDVLCSSYNPQYHSGRFAYSNIHVGYQNLPNFSWTVMVFCHEMGHNIGTPHTHSCSWELSPGNFGPIDTCYQPEGGCYNGPTKPRVGSVMSYCHLTNQGINLNLGFLQQPGDLMRYEVDNAACLQNIPLADLQLLSNAPVCVGDTLIIYNLNALPNYQWSGPGSFSTTDSHLVIPNIGLNQAGLYTLFTDLGNCERSDMINIQVLALPPTATITNLGGVLTLYTGSYTYQWYNANGPIAGAITNTYIPVTNGEYYCIISTIGSGCSTQSDTYSFYVGIEEPGFIDLQIFPNPATDQIAVQLANGVGEVNWKLVDASGKIVLTGMASQNNFTIPLANVANGCYYLHCKGKAGTGIEKCIVMH